MEFLCTARQQNNILRTFVILCGIFAASSGDLLPTVEDIPCPEKWVKIHRGCYKFVTSGLPWSAALDTCKQSHGDLTSIQSWKEKSELETYLSDSSEYSSITTWWAGLQRDTESGSNWTWGSGLPVNSDIIGWVNQKVKSRPGLMCGQIKKTPGNGGIKLWVDKCSKSRAFICEYHNITPRPITNTTTQDPEPDTITTIALTSLETDAGEVLTQEEQTEDAAPTTSGIVIEDSTQVASLTQSSPEKANITSATTSTKQSTFIAHNAHGSESKAETKNHQESADKEQEASVSDSSVPSSLDTSPGSSIGVASLTRTDSEMSASPSRGAMGDKTSSRSAGHGGGTIFDSVQSIWSTSDLSRTQKMMAATDEGEARDHVTLSSTVPVAPVWEDFSEETGAPTINEDPSTVTTEETEAVTDQLDENSPTIPGGHQEETEVNTATTYTTTEEDDLEVHTEQEVPEDQWFENVGRGSVRPRPGKGSTTDTMTRKPTPIQTSPDTTARMRPTAPRPTAVDWEEELEKFEGCYIPSRGQSLKQRVEKARALYSQESGWCPSVQAGKVTWPEMRAGEESKVPCRNGNGFAIFECGRSPACWQGQPDITGCASKKLQSMLKMVKGIDDEDDETDELVAQPSVEVAIEMTSQLVQVTETENVTMEDVMVMSKVITGLTKRGNNKTRTKDKREVEQMVDNVVKAGSNLVSRNKSAMWEEMTQEDKVRSASTLLVALETATVAMADEIEEPVVIEQKDENIELQLRVVDIEELEQQDQTELVYDSDDSDNSFSIPMETLKSVSKGKLAKAVFITHTSMSDFMAGRKRGKAAKSRKETQPTLQEEDPNDKKKLEEDAGKSDMDAEDDGAEDMDEEEDSPTIVSYILSASLGAEGHPTRLPKPVTFSMKHIQMLEPNEFTMCSFWNVSDDAQMGFWSQDGCRVLDSNASRTTCECDHMTNFAILLNVHDVKISAEHQSILRLVTIIGCIISITALVVSWITFQCFISLQGERNSIHKNLALCLLVAELLFVFGIDQAQHTVLCSVIAGFLHYFFLATFFWMFLEGLHIIFMLVQVFDATRSRLPYYYLTGYGAPLLVVCISCIFFSSGYGTDEYCWLSSEHYFIWTFAGPVALILVVNAMFLSYAMTTVCRHADYVFNPKDKSTGGEIRAWIQGALALEVLLGLTWTFGYFVINEEHIALAYIFTVLNSTQGLFIFVFHCLFSKKAQKEYRRVLKIKIKRTPSMTTTHSALTKRSVHGTYHEMNDSNSTNAATSSTNATNSTCSNGRNSHNADQAMA